MGAASLRGIPPVLLLRWLFLSAAPRNIVSSGSMIAIILNKMPDLSSNILPLLLPEHHPFLRHPSIWIFGVLLLPSPAAIPEIYRVQCDMDLTSLR
jgi:hypothetical protein